MFCKPIILEKYKSIFDWVTFLTHRTSFSEIYWWVIFQHAQIFNLANFGDNFVVHRKKMGKKQAKNKFIIIITIIIIIVLQWCTQWKHVKKTL